MHNDLVFLRHETRFDTDGTQRQVAFYRHTGLNREFWFWVW